VVSDERSEESNHMSKRFYVYIALLRDDRFYVGISHQELESLLSGHHSGKHSQFTGAEGLKRILWTEGHPSLASARHREQQLKRWAHAKKQALLDGDFARLKALSRSKSSPWPKRTPSQAGRNCPRSHGR
jgi:predicted GIY-YIG superfamily endonuclease